VLHHGRLRLDQVRELVAIVFERAPIDEARLPPVILADMNAEPDSDELRYLRGLATIDGRSVYFADAWIYAGDGTPGHTFDRRNAFAALAHEPPRRIDYVLVRGPDTKLRGEPLVARLVGTEPTVLADGARCWPSDHYGVYAEIAAAPRD
jgi:endonuclease/exonuclease/phosphatase family metal-dependent hydrolase